METETINDATRFAGETQGGSTGFGALMVPAGAEAAAGAFADGPQPAGEHTGTASALLHAILRLEAVIDEEIVALQARRRVDYDTFSRRKNRGLLELVRSARNAGHHDARISSEIERLRTKLVKNQDLLRLHYDAVRLVADIICKSFREAESDGTYAATSRARK